MLSAELHSHLKTQLGKNQLPSLLGLLTEPFPGDSRAEGCLSLAVG